MNFCAASGFFDAAGIASAQAHSQFAPLSVTADGACAKSTLSATLLCFGSLMNDAAIVASIHIAHLPSLYSARISLKLLADDPGGPYFFSRSTYSVIASFHGLVSSCGFQPMSNHWPPWALTIVVMKAMLSPQPG